MNILTAAEMAATDERTAERGIPISKLMENAGQAVATFCMQRYRRARTVLVLAGKGNNGGDGLVAARILASAGREVHVVLLGRAVEVKGEAAQALKHFQDASGASRLHETAGEQGLAANPAESFASMMKDMPAPELVLDAVVGTGFKPPLRGLAAAARDWVAGVRVPVVAVDLPSGWDADSLEEQASEAFRADAVVTFTAPKRAHVFGYIAARQSAGWPFGPVVVAEIGSPKEAIQESLELGSTLHWAGSAKKLTEAARPVNANKGKFGHVLVVGGSSGTAGAPSMSSLAALRAGAGLVTAAVPRSVADTVALAAVELMVAPTGEGPDGALGLCSLEQIEATISRKRISVLAIGPGLSTRGEASEFARELLSRTSLPVVIDADALNAFADHAELLKQASTRDGKPRTVVLTPHPGEMARLAGLTIKQVESDRLGLARSFATEHGVTLVLKGWRTLIAHPDGRIAVNTTGNPGMAKGGSGDILTGIVAAMVAQYSDDVARAVEAAVFVHGLAGDLAARRMDQHTLLATDTLRHLSDAFRQPVRDRDGFTWISGLQPRGSSHHGPNGDFRKGRS